MLISRMVLHAGTFYRYNNVIYTSFDQIFKDYTGC